MSDDTAVVDTKAVSQGERRFVKSAIPNLFILEPGGVYYGRVKVAGKVHKKSFETTAFSVAKKKLKVWLEEIRGKATNDATLGSLAEEYQKRLQLQVTAGDIKPRTMETKVECIAQCGKVWQELFSTGKIDEANYSQGGNQKLKLVLPCPLFNTQKVSALTPATMNQWRASMCQAYSPSRVNGSMTVMGELLDLAVEMGFLFQADTLRKKLGYVRTKTVKLTHLPTVEKYKALLVEIRDRSARGDAVFQRGLNDSGDLFEFLSTSGARTGSANAVEWDHIDWSRNRLTFYVTKRDNYTIPLFPELRALLEKMKAAAGGNPSGKLFKVKSIKRVLQSACLAVGTPRLTPHDCKHFFATRCIEAGADIPTVSRWLGHKDGGALAMKTYGHLRDEHSQGWAGKIKFS